MKLNTKKFGAFAATLALTLLSVGVISTPARAADCPYPVTDQTSNDNPAMATGKFHGGVTTTT